jgi:twitching motility two-component system response regulator PilH
MTKVLIVDDSPTERHVLQTMLAEAGFDVFQADNGEMGVEQAKLVKPDVILMDVVMPGLNGFQATRKLKQDESTKQIPIVMCTTKSQPTDMVWGMRQGAHSYLVKPIDKKQVIDAVREAVGTKLD